MIRFRASRLALFLVMAAGSIAGAAWGQSAGSNTQSSTAINLSPWFNQSQTQTQAGNGSQYLTTGLTTDVGVVETSKTPPSPQTTYDKGGSDWALVDAGHGLDQASIERNDEIGAVAGRWRLGRNGAWSRCDLYLFGDQTGSQQRAATGKGCPQGLTTIAGWELSEGEMLLTGYDGRTVARLRVHDAYQWNGARTSDGKAVNIVR